MPNNTPASQSEIRELTRLATELVDKVNLLVDGTGDQLVELSNRGKRNRQLIWLLIISFSLDVILTVLMLVGLVKIAHNSDNISRVTERLDVAQTVGRQKALCPLYQLFLDSKSDAARAHNPKGPEAYDNAFATIQRGYDALDCDQFKGGPPSLG